MQEVLLVIHLIVALSIIILVLIQPSEAGGFLGNSGNMTNMMMTRKSGDPMTRATTIAAGIFFVTSLLLAIAAKQQPVEKSILDLAADAPAVEKTTGDAAVDAKVEQKTGEMPAAKEPVAKEPASKKEAPKKNEKPKAPIAK